MMFFRFWKLAILAGSILLATSVSSAESVAQMIYPDDQELVDFSEGETCIVFGKYQGLVEQELLLFEIKLRFILSDKNLSKKLLEFQPNKDNIGVKGFLRIDNNSGNNPQKVFEVTEILSASSDEELFKKKLKQIFSKPDRKSTELFRVAKILYKLREFEKNSSVLSLITKSIFEGLRLAERRLDPKDAQGHFELIVKISKDIPDKALQAQLFRYEAQKFPNHLGLTKALQSMGYRKLNGKWFDYGEFKEREGFTFFRKHWVKKSDKEFFEVIQSVLDDNLTNLILRSKTDRAYAQLANSGKVEKGMNLNEVSIALGYPDRVRRRKHQQNEVDQWDFGDMRVYFINNQVFFVSNSETAEKEN